MAKVKHTDRPRFCCNFCGVEKYCVARYWSPKLNRRVEHDEFAYDERHRAWLCRACQKKQEESRGDKQDAGAL